MRFDISGFRPFIDTQATLAAARTSSHSSALIATPRPRLKALAIRHTHCIIEPQESSLDTCLTLLHGRLRIAHVLERDLPHIPSVLSL
jgi:hypothetical protein